MKQNKPILHARDHLPGGADPIPGLAVGGESASPPGTEYPKDGPTEVPGPKGSDWHWWRFREPHRYESGTADILDRSTVDSANPEKNECRMDFSTTGHALYIEMIGGQAGPNSNSLSGYRKTEIPGSPLANPENFFTGTVLFPASDPLTDRNTGVGAHFTTTVWFKLDELKQWDLLNLNKDGASLGTYLMVEPDGSLTVNRQGTAFNTGPTGRGVSAGDWFYVALVVANGRVKLYLNPEPPLDTPYSPTYGGTFPFGRPLVMETWGLENGDYTAEQLAQRVSGSGFPTVVVQLNGLPRPGRSHADYIAQLAVDVATLKNAGIEVVGWGEVDSSTAADLAATGVDGWMPQIEGPSQYDAALAALTAGVGAGLPKAVVWTQGGINSSSQVTALNAAGITGYAAETYASVGGPFTHADGPIWQGTQFGMTPAQSIPILGTFRGETPDDYTGFDENIIPNYGIYAAPQTSEAAWAAFGDVNKGSTQQSPAVIDEADPATTVNYGVITLGSTNEPLSYPGTGTVKGSHGADGCFEGSVAEMTWYHYALPSSRMRAQYLSGLYGDTGTVPPSASGAAGPPGPAGAAGAAGTPGEKWFTGSGAPVGSLAGSIVGDWYLDSVSGDYYEKTGTTAWTLRGNLKGPAGSGGGGSAVKDKLWTPPASPHSGDDEFNDSTIDAAWANVTPSGTVTWTEDADVLSARYTGQTGGHICVKVRPITISLGGYIETAVRMLGGAANYAMGGLVFTDGTANTSNAAGAFLYLDTGNFAIVASPLGGTINSMPGGASNARLLGPALHIRLVWQAANTWRMQLSPDGVSWTNLGIADLSKTMTPTHMGVLVTAWGGTTWDRVTSFEYFRCSG